MCFGVFLSTICNTSMEAIKLCIGATLPHMLATGIFWPLEVGNLSTIALSYGYDTNQ